MQRNVKQLGLRKASDMKSTKEQISKIQARQASQACSAIDRRDTPTNAHYLNGTIPSGSNVKAAVSKVLKGK
jgi:RNA polymerase-interacting CarD/CdnL/TRCF family regulator